MPKGGPSPPPPSRHPDFADIPWLTEGQKSHCGVTQAELFRDLPSRVLGLLFTGRSLTGVLSAGERYWPCIAGAGKLQDLLN